MFKLLLLNFKTLKRNLLFWVLIAFFVITCFIQIDYMYSYVEGYYGWYDESNSWVELDYTADQELFGYCNFLSFVCAIFTAFHIGKGYRYNTVRNKITRGIKRESVYFSDLLTVFLVCLALVLAYMAVIFVSAKLMNIDFFYDFKGILYRFFLSLFPLLSLCCVFTSISMNIKNEVISVVICLGLIFLIYMLYFDVLTSIESLEYPYNATQAKKDIFKFLYDFLPVSQLSRVYNSNVHYFDYVANELVTYDSELDNIFIPYSLLLSVVSTAVGVSLFKKKNLR